MDAVRRVLPSHPLPVRLRRTMSRQPRSRRDRHRRIEMTERDERVLLALARFRLARTSDLRRAVFPGRHKDTAGERLRKLFDIGLLDVRPGDRSEENVYALGVKGREWLRSKRHEVRRIPRGDARHHLAVVAVWTGVLEALRAVPGARIARAVPDWELRELTPSGLDLVPDLLLHLEVGRGASPPSPLRIAVEVDLGSESVGVLRSKVEKYESARLSPEGLLGWRDFRLCMFAPGAGSSRLDSIRSVIGDGWGGAHALWSSQIQISDTILVLADEIDGPRTDSPHGTGTSTAACPDVSSGSPNPGRGR